MLTSLKATVSADPARQSLSLSVYQMTDKLQLFARRSVGLKRSQFKQALKSYQRRNIPKRLMRPGQRCR